MTQNPVTPFKIIDSVTQFLSTHDGGAPRSVPDRAAERSGAYGMLAARSAVAARARLYLTTGVERSEARRVI